MNSALSDSDSLPTSYCTPEDVEETIDYPDKYDGFDRFRFTDVSHPSRRQVCRMIRSNEDVIDRRMRRSWRENRVKDQVLSINTYWHDENAWRTDYYLQGGDYIQLRKDVRPWDPSKGDKLELRTFNHGWVDVTDIVRDEGRNKDGRVAWFDYPYGKLYIRTRWMMQRYNAVRISYRYGSDIEECPDAINRLCSLMTASQIINMQMFNIKMGMGGDITSIKEAMLSAWQEEMNSIWSSYQRSGSVHSMLR